MGAGGRLHHGLGGLLGFQATALALLVIILVWRVVTHLPYLRAEDFAVLFGPLMRALPALGVGMSLLLWMRRLRHSVAERDLEAADSIVALGWVLFGLGLVALLDGIPLLVALLGSGHLFSHGWSGGTLAVADLGLTVLWGVAVSVLGPVLALRCRTWQRQERHAVPPMVAHGWHPPAIAPLGAPQPLATAMPSRNREAMVRLLTGAAMGQGVALAVLVVLLGKQVDAFVSFTSKGCYFICEIFKPFIHVLWVWLLVWLAGIFCLGVVLLA